MSPNMDSRFIEFPEKTYKLEDEYSSTVTNLFHGHYKSNLNDQVCKNILLTEKDGKCFEDKLILSVETSLEANKDLSSLYDVLAIGISSLQLFIQVNWTGPYGAIKHDPPLQFLRKGLSKAEDFSESQWLEKLSSELVLDGESISPNIHNLELLLVARAILRANIFNNIVSATCWRLRCLYVHQQVLEERSPTLHNEVSQFRQQLVDSELLDECPTLKAHLELEAASMWLLYGHLAKADDAIRSAHKLLGLQLDLIGALGKRTKFQEKELPQLTLSLVIDRNEIPNEPTVLTEPTHFPQDVTLQDDVLLDQIAFSDSSVGEIPTLSPLEQATVLATCMYKQKSLPKDKLHSEEIFPYLTCLTSQPKVWAIQVSALLQRSKLESDHQRTVERAMMQFESLSDSVLKEQPSAQSRIAWFYTSYLPPAWRLQESLAYTYLSLGMVQTALDVFLSLKLWEEVIACYNLLKLRHKAAEVIRQELEKKPSVKLLCLLGDATDDIDCYKQAWELSEERSGRAQRHWAMYYFYRKQYAESIPHLEKSLSLNSLQESLWFRLGFAALMEENWALCATAYRRYCSLEPESFEAWNNLAKAYVKIGQKARAFRALQEAVKCNYENWRVWDNLMAVSTDCGQFEEVIRCYHRILDLNEKHVDLEVLKILTNVVVRGIEGVDKCGNTLLMKLSLKLFGRLTSQVLNNSCLWQLYAQIAASDEPSAQNNTKVAQCLQKAYRTATQGSWERDLTSCMRVTDVCVDLAEAYVKCSIQCGSSNEKVQMLSSAKLPLKSVLTKIEKEHTDLITGELPDSLFTKHKLLLNHYEQIVDEIKRLQGT